MPAIRLNDPDPAVLDGRHIRASAFESAQRELIATLPSSPPTGDTPPARALAIGAGYARLPSLLAAAGYDVTALDPSPEATDAARRQATAPHIGGERARTGQASAGNVSRVEYQVWDPEQLSDQAAVDGPFVPGDPFDPVDRSDVVWCIDTLEIVADPQLTLAAIARMTRPGGTIVLDTLNNTAISRLIYLGLFQRLPATRIMPPGRYRRDRFIAPTDLERACTRAGITIQKIIGYEPASPVALLRALLARRRGDIRDHELADRAGFRLSAPGHTPPVTYYAIGTTQPR